MLGRDIGRFIRRRGQSVCRGNVNDPPPPLRPHHGHSHGCSVECGIHVNRDNRVPFLNRKFVDWGHILDACIVDQNIAPWLCADQVAALLGIGHIRANIIDLHAKFGRQIRSQRMILVRISERIDHQIRTDSRQGSGDSQTDSRG